jgi:uncharacterized protein
MAMPQVFISYRREDSSGYAGRLYDRLAQRFGRDRIYRDIDDISAGEDFHEAIRKKLEQSDILIALIGPRWLAATDQDGRWRLGDEHDLVRLEIAAALNRNIRVIPVLIQGARMPRSNDLPADLAKLAERNAVEIRDTHFDQDLTELLNQLVLRRRHQLAGAIRRRPAISAAVGLLAAALVAAMYFSRMTPTTREQARFKIGQLGVSYDTRTFIDRVQDNDESAVALFLTAGMNADSRDQNGDTALMLATRQGNLKIAKALVEKGADVAPALRVAAQTKDTDMINFLLSRNPSKKAIGEALSGAAGTGSTSLVQTLIDHGADVNADWGGTPLMEAAYYDHLETVQLLLSHGANVNAATKRGETALHYAVRGAEHSIEIVRTLLAKGADVNTRDAEGETPLMQAIVHRRPELAMLLLEHDADVTAVTESHKTALMFAAAENVAAVVEPLVAHGADINARNDKGETALMWATGAVDNTTKSEVVNALLENGADINARDKNGWTPLMFAASQDNDVMVRILIDRGADPHAKNNDGQTALMIATKEKHKDVVKVLREPQINSKR